MAKYSAIAMEHFLSPRNRGRPEDYDFEGRAVVPGQTPFMHVYLGVVGGLVTEAAFVTFGCGAAIACGSMLTEMIKGRTIGDCRALTTESLEYALGELPSDRRFCAGLAIDALRNALNQSEAQ